MDCEHPVVSWTTEPVPVPHVVSVCNWFTCDVCGERAVVVERSPAVGPDADPRLPGAGRARPQD